MFPLMERDKRNHYDIRMRGFYSTIALIERELKIAYIENSIYLSQ